MPNSGSVTPNSFPCHQASSVVHSASAAAPKKKPTKATKPVKQDATEGVERQAVAIQTLLLQ